MTESTPRRIRVAWVHGTDLRPYRIPFLRRLGSREDVDVTLYHGNAKRGIGAPSRPIDITDTGIASRSIRNYFWPYGGHRVMWQAGVLGTIRRRYDVVVVPEIIHNLTVWLIVFSRSLLRRPVVLFGFGYRPRSSSMGSRLRNVARGLLLRRADSIISYTERGRRDCLDQGIDPSRLFVLQNTVDTEHLRDVASGIDPLIVRETHDRYSPRLVIAFLGRLVREKHADVLIDAVSMLEARNVDAALLVVGDGPERDALERRASGVDNVHFFGRVYDEVELARLLLASDLLAIPGRIGLTCVHGFSYSLPALTTSEAIVQQSPEYDYLKDDVNCLILPELDAEVYATALERLARDRAALDELRAGAEQSADTLTMSHMVEAWVHAVSSADRRHR
jgi:glycosyltransferase involved in cell wall biosynthesis